MSLQNFFCSSSSPHHQENVSSDDFFVTKMHFFLDKMYKIIILVMQTRGMCCTKGRKKMLNNLRGLHELLVRSSYEHLFDERRAGF